MKEPKLGDHFYKGRGLIKITVWVKTSVEKRYRAAAKKKGWARAKFLAYWLSAKAPK